MLCYAGIFAFIDKVRQQTRESTQPRTPPSPASSWQLPQLCWVQNNLHIMRVGMKGRMKKRTTGRRLTGNGKQRRLYWMAVTAVARQWIRIQTAINYWDVLFFIFIPSAWRAEYATLKESSNVFLLFVSCDSLVDKSVQHIWDGNWLFYGSFYCGLSVECGHYLCTGHEYQLPIIRIMAVPRLRLSECSGLWGDTIKLILKHFGLNHSCW